MKMLKNSSVLFLLVLFAPSSLSSATSTTPTTAHVAPYWMKVGDAGKTRLVLQCEILNPKTLDLLDTLGLTHESRVLDVGSGTGSIACAIAAKYGCSVLGVDRSEEQLEIARDAASDAKISHLVNFEQCEGSHLSARYREQFDVVMCRLFLCHLENQEEVLTQMAERVKPGGVLVCEDLPCGWKTGRYSCNPPHRAYDFWLKLAQNYETIQGTDFTIGSRLPDLIKSPEFTVEVNKEYQKDLTTPHEKQILRLALEELSDKLVEQKAFTQQEVDEELVEFKSLEDGEYTPKYFPIVQFVARKNIPDEPKGTSD